MSDTSKNSERERERGREGGREGGKDIYVYCKYIMNIYFSLYIHIMYMYICEYVFILNL
jgi:hypothetical protein